MPNSALAEKLLDDVALPGFCEKPKIVFWQLIFFVNVFFACISFSIVMPSLFLYLSTMGASAQFYAVVVAAYSVGEALGSLTLGPLSNAIGTKRTLQLCAMISLSGSISYALADAVNRTAATSDESWGPMVVLIARLLQGIGSGGQQTVEQSYLAIAAPPEERTSLTSQLSTFACLGFIFGPALGAAVTTIPEFTVGPLLFTSFTKQGWVVAVLNVSMLLSTTIGFTELIKPAAETSDEGAEAEESEGLSRETASGVWTCILIFFVHFNGFAVQETITTPLVQDWFGWDEVQANLLFTAAGVANLLCAVVMSYLAGARLAADGSLVQVVDDRTLLVCSCVLALAGWALLVPPDGWGLPGPPMGLPQFGVAFALVTVAFPFGRSVCLSMVGKLLGERPQGAWMGTMFALGAIARIAGPFWAVTGYNYFGSLSVFGSTAVLFGTSLVATRVLWDVLAPGAALPPPGELSPSKVESQSSYHSASSGSDHFESPRPSRTSRHERHSHEPVIFTGTPDFSRVPVPDSVREFIGSSFSSTIEAVTRTSSTRVSRHSGHGTE